MLFRFPAAVLLAGLGFAAVVAVNAQGPDDTASRLALIKKVGREGDGNAEAAKAWKSLVSSGPDALLPILDAMNDDDLTSANWLRPAFEAIAEKALDNKKLPKADLEKYVEDTKKGGGARRLAYEWLVKLDKDAPDRLLPKMLLDPSIELRRDAVARAIKEAEVAEGQSEKLAKEAYHKALTGACDLDQVDAIAKGLEKLGEKLDKAKHFGFVMNWHLIGPFEHHKGVGWDAAYAPEKGVDLAKEHEGKGGKQVAWKAHVTKEDYGVVNLNAAVDKVSGAVAYAYAIVESPEERQVDVRFGSPNAVKVFVNGRQAFAHLEYHHNSFVDQFVARVTLRKGANHILVKVCQNEQTEAWAQRWQFQLRLCDRVGSAVPFTQKAEKGEDK